MPDLVSTARRVVVLGDELVAGFGDPRALGWVGRVLARSQTADPADSVLAITLPVPGETTTALGARWERELSLRVTSPERSFVVIGLGAHDLTAGISLARSRLNLANVLDATSSVHLPTLVVGPPPRQDLDPDALAELSTAFGDVCDRRRVPYVETYAPLAAHEQWLADLAAGDGIHPAQAGHGLLAWLVLHHGWHAWLGVPEPA
ncbi:MAG TPA: lysophospholipase [Micrococcales bacterium]|uniref:Lysophospholipase n=1 Tax=Miniimonas arenae TaxID=676201 RepID=A0A5C5BDC6_9MICO|nr:MULTISPECIES: GDSL-type esterase/lipase family protein [Miniimonas]TNU75959.1 lysophospholipase [Miniimonas arenae]HCX86042.1 lysophospholipase [Micrococcales bacterium]